MVPPKVFTYPFRNKIIYHKLLCAINSVRLKSSVSSKWTSKLLWGYHLFCCWWYISSAIEIISDEISPASCNFLTSFTQLGPPWCNLANRETEDKENSSFKRRWPCADVCLNRRAWHRIYRETGRLSLWFAVILSSSKLFKNSEWIFSIFIAEINGEII